MIKDILKSYLKEIHHKFSQGDAREESYYPIMEQMILSAASLLGKSKVEVTTLPKKTEGGNPDFRVWDGKSMIIGYIEAKNLETDLDDVENGDQLKRYRDTFPNLILTNFLEFRFYRDGRLMDSVSIGRRHTLLKIGSIPVLEDLEKFKDISDRFFSFTFPRNLNARRLAKELAKRTRFLRDQVIIEELKEPSDEKTNYILGFYNAFKKYLIYGLTEAEFADLYSQTVTYGLFAARTRCKDEFHRKNAVDFIPQSIGILHDVFYFISAGQTSKHLECIIDDISEVLASVDVGYILDEFFQYGKGDDPIIHFYETFLSEYDPGLREKRGVYYTPEPVVYFIVRSLNSILKDHFKLPKGLADDRIKILDPAAGTLTFIAVAVRIALEEYLGLFGEGVKENFVRVHFLENFYAFELMMAPYAIGHLKMSYILEEKGIHLKENERLKLYLTNTLEMEDIEQINLPFMSTLSEESRKAGEIKKHTPILVILGNPPYSGHSSNVGDWISAEIKEYYKVDGSPLGEKNPKWLQDDYVKFIRFSQWKIDRNGEGVLGFITNHSYLDNPTFRGMRQSLMKSFNEIYILDLHGNARKKERCPDGSKDENVFDISQGTAIALFIKKRSNKTPCRVFHADLWGPRENKYNFLTGHDSSSIQWKEVFPKSGLYLFIPRNEELDKLYLKFFKISEIFPLYGVGMTTARDEFIIDNDKSALLKRIILFKNHKGSDDDLHNFFKINRKKGWSIRKAWNLLQPLTENEIENLIKPVLYRPFDFKWIFYHDSLVWRTAKRIMENMFEKNIGLIFHKREELQIPYSHFLISNFIVEHGCLSSKTTCYLSPFYIYNGIDGLYKNDRESANDYNIDKKIMKSLYKKYKSPGLKPELILYYVYAVFYSKYYREKYSELLRIDFPRVPFTSDYNLFLELGTLGKELAYLHLMKSPQLNQTFSRYEVPGDNIIKKATYNPEEKRVYIDGKQYFSSIDKEIWEYQIGGYQVMEKWLKDRKNRLLSLQDIEHYIKIARALQLTIQYQEKIDDLYPGIEENLIS
jgi:type I restriction-modification system DNA methylase subunit